MKKYLLAPLMLLFLVSCNVVWNQQKTDFTSLYNANVKAELAELDATWKNLYKNKHAEADVRGHFEGIDMNGKNLLADIKVKSEAYNDTPFKSMLTLNDLQGNLISDKNKIAFSAKTIDIITAVNAFVKLNGLNVETNFDKENEAQALEIKKNVEALQKFADKWIVLDGNNNDLHSEQKMFKGLSQLTMADIEKSIIEYPLFVATGSGVVKGDEYTFPVALHTDNVAQMVQYISQKLGAATTAEQMTEIKEKLKNVVYKGTITYNAKNPIFSKMDSVISVKDSAFALRFVGQKDKNSYNYTFVPLQEDGKDGNISVNITSKTEGKKTDFVLSATDAELKAAIPQTTETATVKNTGEIVRITGHIEDGVLKNLDANGDIMGGMAKFTVQYKNDDLLKIVANVAGQEMVNIAQKWTNDNLVGKALFQGKEVAQWSLQMTKKTLTQLIVSGVHPLFPDQKLIDINLSAQPNSELIAGKALINAEMFGFPKVSSDMRLQFVEGSKFGFELDNILSDGKPMPVGPKKVNLFTTYKESDSNKTITIPTDVIQADVVKNALEMGSSEVIMEDEAPTIKTATGEISTGQIIPVVDSSKK